MMIFINIRREAVVTKYTESVNVVSLPWSSHALKHNLRILFSTTLLLSILTPDNMMMMMILIMMMMMLLVTDNDEEDTNTDADDEPTSLPPLHTSLQCLARCQDNHHQWSHAWYQQSYTPTEHNMVRWCTEPGEIFKYLNFFKGKWNWSDSDAFTAERFFHLIILTADLVLITVETTFFRTTEMITLQWTCQQHNHQQLHHHHVLLDYDELGSKSF